MTFTDEQLLETAKNSGSPRDSALASETLFNRKLRQLNRQEIGRLTEENIGLREQVAQIRNELECSQYNHNTSLLLLEESRAETEAVRQLLGLDVSCDGVAVLEALSKLKAHSNGSW
jgi:hypothetical protein